MNQKKNYEVKDLKTAVQGANRIEWAKNQMPVLRLLQAGFAKEKPLKDIKIAASLHVTAETAVLMEVLKTGGAEIALCASNPLSTQDDVAAHLVKNLGIQVFAIKGEREATYYRHLNYALKIGPQLTMDDGADLVSTIHKSRRDLLGKVFGGSEETTTGVIRLRAMEKDGALKYPIIAVNDAKTKYLFDNRYGTGQSTIDGILRATNVLLSGSNFVICGYGWCGKGVAMRAKGMGARVTVCEVDPLKALEAKMDGFEVLPLLMAARKADLIVTLTGNKAVVDERHFRVLKSGAILANAGHFNVELNLEALKAMQKQKRQIREFVEEYELKDGRKIYILGNGRLINLSAAEGHPAAVMDMSFADQALAAVFLVKNRGKLEDKVYGMPEKLDREVARLKLQGMGVKIDTLSGHQKKYLSSWREGT